MTAEYRELIMTALRMRSRAYSPYSGFAVGAALLSKSGKVYTGANIENAAYSPTLCAERAAFAAAVSAGDREFIAIAVAGGPANEPKPSEYCTPCGVCRQVMAEFCRADFVVLCAKRADDYKVFLLGELLPEFFKKN
jgi:cytidine deaminase